VAVKNCWSFVKTNHDGIETGYHIFQCHFFCNRDILDLKTGKCSWMSKEHNGCLLFRLWLSFLLYKQSWMWNYRLKIPYECRIINHNSKVRLNLKKLSRHALGTFSRNIHAKFHADPSIREWEKTNLVKRGKQILCIFPPFRWRCGLWGELHKRILTFKWRYLLNRWSFFVD